MGGWGMYPRRRYYGGGGCLGGLLSMIFGPIIFIFVLLFFLSGFLSSGVDVQVVGSYDENTFQDYANTQYEEAFGHSSAYEDNLLIAVLVEDEYYYDYYYIAWVGDHIATDINYMLCSNDTELGRAMDANINMSSYKYSLDSNLAQVIYEMTDEITALGLESSYRCTEDHIQVASRLINHSTLDLTASTVNEALTAFTDATGIPIVIVVEDMDDVFSTTTRYDAPVSNNSGSFLAVIGIAAVVIIIFFVKKNKRVKYDGVPENEHQNNRYSDFDDQL